MKNIKYLLYGVLCLGLVSCASSGSNSGGKNRVEAATLDERIQSTFTYKNLAMLDLDQMNDILKHKIKEYQRDNNIMALKEAARIVYSRPDSDSVVEKIISDVRNPLEDENQWEPTIITLVKQSVETMKDDATSATDQVTSGTILENIIADSKPAYKKQYSSGGLETDVIDYIADHNAVYSKKANSERSLSIMKSTLSPGKMAQKIQNDKNESKK